MLARREIYIIAGVVYFLPSDPKQTKCCNLVLLTSPGSCFPWKHVHLVLTLLHFETAVSILFLLFKKSKKSTFYITKSNSAGFISIYGVAKYKPQ